VATPCGLVSVLVWSCDKQEPILDREKVMLLGALGKGKEPGRFLTLYVIPVNMVPFALYIRLGLPWNPI